MINIAVVGLGKIAMDQHLPVINNSSQFCLTSTVSSSRKIEGVENYRTIEEALGSDNKIDAFALCTPPSVRYEQAMSLISAGKHVLLEKPPCRSLDKVHELKQAAVKAGVALVTSYHSRHAPVINSVTALLEEQKIISISTRWLEDADQWHPNQTWIWEEGGFGVFDAGINAFSILTEIINDEFRVTRSNLTVLPGCHSPVTAAIELVSNGGVETTVELDWAHRGEPVREIVLHTNLGQIVVSEGGHVLSLGGACYETDKTNEFLEYEGVYTDFAQAVSCRAVICDPEPLRLVLEAMKLGLSVDKSRGEA